LSDGEMTSFLKMRGF